jgi:hypothetical protein
LPSSTNAAWPAGEHKHKLAKVGVEGSNPFARSNNFRSVPDTWVTFYTGDMGNTFGPNGLSSGSSLHVS